MLLFRCDTMLGTLTSVEIVLDDGIRPGSIPSLSKPLGAGRRHRAAKEFMETAVHCPKNEAGAYSLVPSLSAHDGGLIEMG